MFTFTTTPRCARWRGAGQFLPVLQRRLLTRGLGLPHIGGNARGGVRRATESSGWSKSRRFFSEQIWTLLHVLVVGERLCGLAKPLEWPLWPAGPLHLRNRIPWSRQPSPPRLPWLTHQWTNHEQRVNLKEAMPGVFMHIETFYNSEWV